MVSSLAEKGKSEEGSDTEAKIDFPIAVVEDSDLLTHLALVYAALEKVFTLKERAAIFDYLWEGESAILKIDRKNPTILPPGEVLYKIVITEIARRTNRAIEI